MDLKNKLYVLDNSRMFAVLPLSFGIGTLYAIKRTYRYSVKTAAATRIQSVFRMHQGKKAYKRAVLERFIEKKLREIKEPFNNSFHADSSDAENYEDEDLEFARKMRKHMKSVYNKPSNKTHRMMTRRQAKKYMSQ